jgi:hypothetical protein
MVKVYMLTLFTPQLASKTASSLLWDALDARFRTVRLKRDPACALCGPEASIHDLSAHENAAEAACRA